MFFNNPFITASDIKAYVNKLVDKKMSEVKVRIPQEQINNAVVKFFTEKKWFLTEDGKKLDTYDLIRKFAMNTIGVADKGELNPEMLKIVQQEVANIIAKEGIKNFNNNGMYTWTEYYKPEDKTSNDNSVDDEAQAIQDIADEDAAYEQGWTDCSKITTVYLNSYFKLKGIDAQAIIDPEVNEIVIVDESGDRFEFFDDITAEEVNEKCDCTDCGSCSQKSEAVEETKNDACKDSEEFAIGFTEELLGKKLNADEKTVLKSCLESLNQLFEQTEKKSNVKKKKK